MSTLSRQTWLPPAIILLSAILISQIMRPGTLPWTTKMPLIYPEYTPPPNMTPKTWGMKYSPEMIPVFTFEDLSIPIYPLFDKSGTRIRCPSKDEGILYCTMTWPQREIYHTATRLPPITDADVVDTEQQIAEFVELRKKLAPIVAAEEEANKIPKSAKEEYEESVARYDSEPVLLTDRKRPITVADRIMMGEFFACNDEMSVIVSEEETKAYLAMNDQEKQKWLKKNEVQDNTELFKEIAREHYERMVEQESKGQPKSDFVKMLLDAIGCGFGGCKEETDGTTGFVGYRVWYGDDEAWEEYKVKALEAIVQHWKYEADRGGDPDNVLEKFRVAWVDDKKLEAATIADIRKLALADLPEIGPAQILGFSNSNLYPFGVLYADKTAIASVLSPSEPRSGLPGHKSEPPHWKPFAGRSKVRGLPYLWFVDHLYGSSVDGEDYYDDDEYNGYWKVALEAIPEFWEMTTVAMRPIERYWPGPEEDDILSTMQ